MSGKTGKDYGLTWAPNALVCDLLSQHKQPGDIVARSLGLKDAATYADLEISILGIPMSDVPPSDYPPATLFRRDDTGEMFAAFRFWITYKGALPVLYEEWEPNQGSYHIIRPHLNYTNKGEWDRDQATVWKMRQFLVAAKNQTNKGGRPKERRTAKKERGLKIMTGLLRQRPGLDTHELQQAMAGRSYVLTLRTVRAWRREVEQDR